MGRAPCCDKANVKKGPWSPEEDAKLKSYIEQHGTGGNWIALPQKIGLKRCGKSCRLRWLNYLRPNIKHGGFSEEEDNLICSLYISIGSRWSIIAAQLPGRTDNDIKNYWNTRLKKKLLGKQRKEQQAARRGQKQDLTRGNANGIAHSMAVTQHQTLPPYWPEMPPPVPVSIPYSNQEPRFNDHASIRKLLIKLGGRFSEQEDDDHHKTSDGVMNNLQFPIDVSSAATEQQLYDSLSIMDSTTGADHEHQFGHSHGSYLDGSKNHFQMLQGQSSTNYPVPELEEISMVYSNSGGARLDGLEFLYGQDNNLVIDNRSAESWSEMSSLVIAPSVEAAAAGMLQEGCFDDGLRYTPAAAAAATATTGRV